nr:phospholipase-like protein [Tanacetum cinerariifolium]
MATRLSHSSVKQLADEAMDVGKKLLELPSSSAEIINSLAEVEQILFRVQQSPSRLVIKALDPIITALVAKELLIHPDVDVNISVASLNAELLVHSALSLVQTKVEKTAADLHELVGLVSQLVRIVDSVAPPIIHSDFAEPPAKKPEVVIDIPIPAPTPLNSIKPTIIDNILYEQFNANLFSSGSSEFSHTPFPSMTDKGKGIAQTLKQLMPLLEEGGSTLNLLNLHQLLGKLQRREREELKFQEVFVKDNIVVDGMHINLVPPAGVVGSPGD